MENKIVDELVKRRAAEIRLKLNQSWLYGRLTSEGDDDWFLLAAYLMGKNEQFMEQEFLRAVNL